LVDTLKTTRTKTKITVGLEALGQCIPPPRHVLPVSRSGSGSTKI